MRFQKIVLILLLPVASFAQTNTLDFSAYMQGQAELYGFNGNVLVAKNGKAIYERSFGVADYDNKKSLDVNSRFDIGSITKEFTAVGILLLVDKGKLNYDDSLRKFFPELPYHNITIAQLLTHTSGMPDGFDVIEKNFDHDKIATNTDLVKLLASEKPPLMFEPGTDLKYSGTGFNLLASVIEKVSGMSYNHYLEKYIFQPLGMKATIVANFPRQGKNIASLANGFIYSDSLKIYQQAEMVYPNWCTYFTGINGEGMIITSTADLLKWDNALKKHSLLSEKTQKNMQSVHAEKKTFPKVKFGYGIRVGSNDLGNYLFHNGWFPGFTSMLIRYVEQDVTVIILSNNQSHSEFIADALAAIALKKAVAMPYKHRAITQVAALQNYPGKFLLPLTRPPYMVTFPAEIVLHNNNLFLQSWNEEIKLIPESATKFFYADGTDQQIEYENDADGKAIKVFYIGYGIRREIERRN
ncbi:MAG: serine hydrolase domain-containing protein [Ferruginibacter sp.]